MLGAREGIKGKHKNLNGTPRTPRPAPSPDTLIAQMPSAGQLAALELEEASVAEQVSARIARVAVAEPPRPEPKPTKTKPEKPKQPKPPADKGAMARFGMIAGGIVLLMLGGSMVVLGKSSAPIIGMGVFSVLGGGYLGFKGFKYEGGSTPVATVVTPAGVVATDKKGKVVTAKPNSLNIYPDRVAFEYVENPPGLPQRFRRDNKQYFINQWDEVNQKFVRFVPPDTTYLDPKLAAIPLYMPANRRLFRKRNEGLLKQLTPWAIVVAMLIVGFLMMTIGGGNNGG